MDALIPQQNQVQLSISDIISAALSGNGIAPSSVVLISTKRFESALAALQSYTCITLPGRSIPMAEGIKTVNPILNVFVVGTYDDLFEEGIGSFISACSTNIDITAMLLSDTKGRINSLVTAITHGATFVAQGVCTDNHFSVDLVSKGIGHHGFSFISLFPHIQNHMIPLPEGYDPHNQHNAYEKVLESTPLGVLLTREGQNASEQHSPFNDISNIDISKEYASFM